MFVSARKGMIVSMEIPEFLNEMLLKQYGEELTKKIKDGYLKQRFVTLRVNTIKTSVEDIKQKFLSENIKFKEVSWFESALIIENVREDEIEKLDIYANGEIYLQSLSSMIPPLIVKPKERENILDMAAAPGGKTTEMASLSENKALITACEKNKIRADRLEYNLNKQGVRGANILREDARNLSDFFSFDKILLDAPCSGSGTINTTSDKFKKYFTEELIKRSCEVQEKLLRKALKLLKSGNEMVYSTCSILQQENEDILNKVINQNNAEIVPIDLENFKGLPLLPTKIDGTLCVMPTELYEGFFVAKIRKK
jgi:NOL1/NOP2/sun family putative RNA methylase